ncbi:hypothetical protein AtNW77_Chr5g0123291 [Arabidopsis thaliana]|uniref:Uncharacterized protein n=2 Tax=Arabidopsis thaliana TaxID=3702 RepID=A0A654G7U8_ARATH|nr:hypothetical protein (DUF 3339) [Arabidopsis thaliana]AED94620.2 hypothetical protein (DUF 3339) [Arabidopsis thaliana]CAA0406663.1 unnamed protein product [Arabidopsis thaliana]VYS68884.1 unnamed protein product [Arabidopsis thaliana]|eukprot:NP_001318719.1 hypothetical protein (DUF 3339) [Arabidopsis thaliana]
MLELTQNKYEENKIRIGLSSAFLLCFNFQVSVFDSFTLSHESRHRFIEKRRLLLRFLLHSNGGLGSSSRRSCIIRYPFSGTSFLVARTSPYSPIRRHENQRQSHRRSHTHLLRCLHHLDPRCQSPHHYRLIYGPK